MLMIILWHSWFYNLYKLKFDTKFLSITLLFIKDDLNQGAFGPLVNDIDVLNCQDIF